MGNRTQMPCRENMLSASNKGERTMKLWKKAVIVVGVAMAAMCNVHIAQAQNYREEDVVKRLSLLGENSVEGDWAVEKDDVTSGGQVFSGAASMNVDDGVGGPRSSIIVFSNADNYDFFECIVGFKGGFRKGYATFEVRGNGKNLYNSPRLGANDSPVRIRVSIKEYSGITLIASGDKNSHFDSALWIQPVFVKVAHEDTSTNDAPPQSQSDAPSGTKVLRIEPSVLDELAADIKAQLLEDDDLAKTKPTLAIAPFQLIPADTLASSNSANVREDLSTALIKTKVFKVVERGQLDKALAELKIGLSNSFDSAKAQKLGKLVSARLVLIGSISDRGTYAVINARLIDTETGEVNIASSAEARQ
jgi:TolB-like protein